MTVRKLTSQKPQSSDRANVRVTTSLDSSTVALGEGVKLRAKLENRTGAGLPMILARIGLPGGLTFQTWQLEELRHKGVVDFYYADEDKAWAAPVSVDVLH